MTRISQNSAIKTALVLLLLASPSCVPVTETQIHEGNERPMPTSLAVLPFKSDVTSAHTIDSNLLRSFQEQLMSDLRKSGRYPDSRAGSENAASDVFVQCTITQFDSAARRVVILTEVVQGKELIKRMVTHSDLASLIWPIDYLIGLRPLWDSAISDIARAL